MDRTELSIGIAVVAASFALTAMANHALVQRDDARREVKRMRREVQRMRRTCCQINYAGSLVLRTTIVPAADAPVSPAYDLEGHAIVVTFKGPTQIYDGLAPSYTGHQVVLANRGPGIIAFVAPDALPGTVNYDVWISPGGWVDARYDGTRWVFEAQP